MAMPQAPTDPKPRAARRPTALSARLLDVFAIDSRTLAVTRISLALVLLGDYASRARDLTAMYTDQGLLPRGTLHEYHRFAGSWYWSLHALDGSAAFQAGLFLLAGLLAVGLLLGYYTRWATIGSWVLLTSLHARMPLLVSGGDVLLCMLLFWGIFLPWGARWSIDARRRPRGPSPTATLSPASAAILLQVALMYLLTGLGKWNEVWLSGQAVENALSYDMIARPLGRRLLDFPSLLRGLTWGTLAWELAAPLLLFCPWGNRYTRPVAWAGLVALHVGIELTMQVTVFSFASLAGLTLFLTPWFWRLGWVRKRLGSPEASPIIDRGRDEQEPAASALPPPRSVWRSRAAGALVVLMMIYIFGYNIGWQLGGDRFLARVPSVLHRLADLGRFGQRWTMFVRPEATDYRFAALARLRNGRVVDVLRDGAPVAFREADNWPAFTPSQRWMQAMRELSDNRYHWFRQSAAEYLARRWNRAHPGDRRIEMLDLLAVQVKPWSAPPHGPPMIRLARVDSLALGPFRDGLRHGPWVLLHEDGTLSARGRYEHGMRQGDWEMFHENGRRAAAGPYRDDLEHGHWTHWYADGRKEAQGDYREGRMHGRWIFWYEDGRRLEMVYDRGRQLPVRSKAGKD